jgi:tRNA G46 methylase TrmB
VGKIQECIVRITRILTYSPIREVNIMEEYLKDEEYEGYFGRLGGMRGRIVDELQIKKGMAILDVGCGYGYFTVEVANQFPGVKMVGIDIAKEDIEKARRLAHAELAKNAKKELTDSPLCFPPGNRGENSGTPLLFPPADSRGEGNNAPL